MGGGSSSVDLQCLIIAGGGPPFSFDGGRLTFSGGIDLNGQNLALNSSPASAAIFVGLISGNGGITTGGPGTVHLFGTNNTFTGTLRVGNGVTQLEKNAGQIAIPANGRLEIAVGATVRLQANEQIFDSSTVVLESGGQFLLNGFNETLGGGLTLWGGGVIDCGNNYGTTGLTLLSNITVRATNSPAVIRSGIVALNSTPLTFDIDGPASPALEISANLIGTGFTKTGAGALRLSGTNSYVEDLIIQGGEVEAFHSSAFGATSGGVQLNGGSIRVNNSLSIGAERLTANGSALQSTRPYGL